MLLPSGAKRVLVVGSLNMDLLVHVPRLPARGETVVGGGLLAAPGGKGANQAVAARRLGAEVALLGHVGADAFGTTLVDGLAAEGVDVALVQRVGVPTGVALITVDASGENTIALAPGANRHLSRADAHTASEWIASADVCLGQLEVPLKVVGEVFGLARAAGVTTILNAAPAAALPASLLRHTSVCILNTVELDRVSNDRGGGATSLAACARRLLDDGVAVVVVTQGAQPTLAVTAAGEQIEVAPPRVEPVDTVGAGDAFVGTFAALCGALSGEALWATLQWANAAGALATQRRGAQPSLPTRADLARAIQAAET